MTYNSIFRIVIYIDIQNLLISDYLFFTKRLKELEKKQEEFLSQVKGLDLVDKPPENDDYLVQERKVILREITDVKIGIRNMQRNRKRELVALKSVLTPDCEEKCSHIVPVNAAIAHDDVDPADYSFNPEAVQLNLTRPEMRIYPKIPLPHSQPLWDRVVKSWEEKREDRGQAN